MEYKCNKQYWLENVLKKFYKKVHALEKVKPRNLRRRNLKISLANVYKNQKMKKCQERNQIVKNHIVSYHTKQKSLKRKTSEKHAEKEQIKPEIEEFWKFVDEFLQSRSFLQRNKNAFLMPVIPSTIDNTLLGSVGNSLNLRSRVVSRHTSSKFTLPGDYGEEGNALHLRSKVVSRHTSNKSTLPGDYGEEGFLRSELSLNGGRKALAQKIFFTIQKARMKKAADVIAKEVLGERKARKI